MPGGVSLPNAMDLAQFNLKGTDDTIQKNRVKFQVEVKAYSNSMIKESIWASLGSI